MSATNTTTNLGLSQFVNTDVPAWRQDYNGDMLKIDNAYTADISGATAETSADPSDYMKFYDVSATTNKKILISDLLKGAKVEDLTDTDITTPIEDDALVYDSTSQKWENKQITTKEQWKKNGAYNLFNPTLASQVTHGITLVKNGGVYSFAGTSDLSSVWSLEFGSYTIPADGDYKIVGCDANGGYGSDYWIGVTKNNVGAGYDDGQGKIITCSKGDVIKLNVCFYNLYAITGTVYFKPMITTDLNATYDDYVPYAKTNRELTLSLIPEDISSQVTAQATEIGSFKVYRLGKIVIVSVITTSGIEVGTGAWVRRSLLTGLPYTSTNNSIGISFQTVSQKIPCSVEMSGGELRCAKEYGATSAVDYSQAYFRINFVYVCD